MESPKKRSAVDEEKEKIKEQKEKEKKAGKPVRVEKKEIRSIIRIADTDLDADKPLIRAIMGINGISHSMAKAICEVSGDRKSTRLNSSHANISYAVFCLKKKKKNKHRTTNRHRQKRYKY